MPLTSYGEPQMLQALFGANTTGIPGTYYVGLITSAKGVYSSSITPAVGDLIVPTNFSTTATNKLYRCVATSGSAASGTATFNTGAGQTTQDATSSATWWQEVSPYFYGTVAVLSASSGTSAGTTTLTVAQGSTQATGTPLTTALANGTSITVTDPTGAHTQTFTTNGTPTAGTGGSYVGGGANYIGSTTITIASATPTYNFPAGSTVTLATSTSGYFSTEVVNSNNYARQPITNSQTSAFAAPQSPSPLITTASVSTYGSTTNYTNAVTFPSGASTSSGSWGYVCGFFLASLVTQGAGNVFAWNTLSNYVPMLTSGMQITLPATTGITVTLA